MISSIKVDLHTGDADSPIQCSPKEKKSKKKASASKKASPPKKGKKKHCFVKKKSNAAAKKEQLAMTENSPPKPRNLTQTPVPQPHCLISRNSINNINNTSKSQTGDGANKDICQFF